jgi:hypothetical protein
MSKTRYSATFTLPDGSKFVLTRGSRQDYGYTCAWCVMEQGVISGHGFSKTQALAEQYTRDWLRHGQDRIALYAPVTKGGAS